MKDDDVMALYLQVVTTACCTRLRSAQVTSATSRVQPGQSVRNERIKEFACHVVATVGSVVQSVKTLEKIV
jgi:hypothetical protein